MRHSTLRIALLAAAVLAIFARAGAAQTVEYYHLDALGSVRAVTDQSGAVIERHDYLPFGEESEPPAVTQTRHFTGKERDAETGMDYFGARYFSAKTARFTTVDPVFTWEENLVDPQRWNRYAYVRNNPLRYTDPDGRCIGGCVGDVYTLYLAGAAAITTAVYLNSPAGREAVSQVVNDARTMITAAVGAISAIFQSEKRPGTLGKPDHQATVADEAARIGGRTEVPIPTPGGAKDSRRADAARVNPKTGAVEEVAQVYRPTPAGTFQSERRMRRATLRKLQA